MWNKFSIQYLDICRIIRYNCSGRGNCILPSILEEGRFRRA
nr:MAG TPA: hypothetical protein [Caudoviricetes sp.]